MRKVLLVIDDFNELVGLEKLFRRLGFDVLSLGRDATVGEVVLYFPPDLCIASFKGKNVDGTRLRGKLRKSNSDVKLVVLLPQGMTLSETDVQAAEVDAVIETPFDPVSALRLVAKMMRLNVDEIESKYQKIVSAKLFQPDELRIVKSSPDGFSKASPRSIERSGSGEVLTKVSGSVFPLQPDPLTKRELKYQEILAHSGPSELPPIADVETLRSGRRQLAIDSQSEKERLAEIDRLKRQFVKMMVTREDSNGQGSNEGGVT